MARLERSAKGIISAILFVGPFIGGFQLRLDEPIWGVALIAASVIPLRRALFAGVFLRRGRG